MKLDSENNGLLVFPSVNTMLAELKRKKYQLTFIREAAHLFCFELNQWIAPVDFTVDESYYFQDMSNPDADRMLYAISLSQGAKGVLVDACGVYADNISPEMMQKLRLK